MTSFQEDGSRYRGMKLVILKLENVVNASAKVSRVKIADTT